VSSAPLPEAARQNIRAVRELEAQTVRSRTRADRVSAAVGRFVGSFPFLFAQVVGVAGWVAVNLYLEPAGRAFDPYPYNFLGLLLSAEAILLSTFVLMAQNRETREAEQREHIHLQVALLAERETTRMLQMLRAICERVGLKHLADDRELNELVAMTQIDELARELEKARADAPAGASPDGAGVRPDGRGHEPPDGVTA
jgi:uncharacterized membrane protein